LLSIEYDCVPLIIAETLAFAELDIIFVGLLVEFVEFVLFRVTFPFNKSFVLNPVVFSKIN